VNVRRTEIGVVHDADADEANGGAGLRLVTPNRNPARRATRNLLTLAARRGRPHEFGLAGRVYDTIGLIESIERMHGTGLTLAPATMASMNNQRHSDQPISNLPACAPAFHLWLHQRLLVNAPQAGPAAAGAFSKQHVKKHAPAAKVSSRKMRNNYRAKSIIVYK
jgi:hypothetical protein